jgi:beta-lactamase superfamily II metal-dependent hydrolase
MLNVTPKEGQADCHLIRLPNGHFVLIDIADAWDATGAALGQLRRLGVTHLDLIVISHFHWDHYGRLLDLLDSGVTVDRIALNVPDRACADREKPWGCDWNDVQHVLEELRRRGVPFFTPAAGQRLIDLRSPDGKTITSLDVLCCYNGIDTPVGPTDVNDTSIVARLTHGSIRVLFTGDLNQPLGAYLAASSVDLRADLLKVPHHGTEGVAPDAFFDRVAPRAALVPAPRGLWVSARSMRIRNYFLDRKIPVYVSGVNGIVTVTIRSNGYVVETER